MPIKVMDKLGLITNLFTLMVMLIPALVVSDPKFNTVNKILDYKYSFKPPHIIAADGRIPFWERFGNAIAGPDNIRVAQSLRSQKGSIWCKNKTNFDWWEVEIVFRVSGRGRVGADGLAFWYIEEKGLDGSVFGGPDKWKGLAVFFDSFDNDNKHDNPYIMAMTNDGTKEYDHNSDGISQKAAGCVKDYRNKPFPLRAKIRYHNRVLTLYFNNGMSKGTTDGEYELCFKGEDLTLPKNGFFGVSAATGGLADDHDIQYFLTWRIDETFHFTPDNPSPELLQYDKEYLEYEQKLQQQKHNYEKEHPEAIKKPEDDVYSDDYVYNEAYNKELQGIFYEQSQVKVYTSMITQQLEEVALKHEEIIKTIETYKSSQGSYVTTEDLGIVGTNATVNQDGLQRFETMNILTANAELLKLIGSVKADLQILGGKIAKPPSGQIPGIPSDNPSDLVHEIIEDVQRLNKEIESMTPKVIGTQRHTATCPMVICISTKLYVGFSLITTGIVIGYMLYKDNIEPPVKKFY